MGTVRLLLVIGGAVASRAGHATVAASDPVKADTAVTAAPLPNDTGKKVCRVVTPTGSRFTQRICKTLAEWQRDSDKAQEIIDREARGNRDVDPGPTR